MDDLSPLLQHENNFTFKIVSIIYSALIVVFSIFTLFFSDLNILSKKSFHLIFPFFTNIFVENDFPMFAVSTVLTFLLFNILLQSWELKTIILYSYIVSFLCNTVIFFILFLFSPSICQVNGALSLLVSLSFATVYAFNQKLKIFGNFTAQPIHIFYAVGIWVILCIRRYIGTMLSGVLSFVVSYVFLSKLQKFFGFPRNENFTLKMLYQIHKEDDEEILQQPSIIDSLGLAQNQNLSEAEQNRRLRALRAIEERLESI